MDVWDRPSFLTVTGQISLTASSATKATRSILIKNNAGFFAMVVMARHGDGCDGRWL